MAARTVHHEWVKKADEDWVAGTLLLKQRSYTGPICFHFHQAAEKYLKALLTYHRQRIPRVHDLLQLETLLTFFEPNIATLDREIDILNRYYIETRYPGDFPVITIKEAEGARDAVGRISEFVRDRITEH